MCMLLQATSACHDQILPAFWGVLGWQRLFTASFTASRVWVGPGRPFLFEPAFWELLREFEALFLVNYLVTQGRLQHLCNAIPQVPNHPLAVVCGTHNGTGHISLRVLHPDVPVRAVRAGRCLGLTRCRLWELGCEPPGISSQYPLHCTSNLSARLCEALA